MPGRQSGQNPVFLLACGSDTIEFHVTISHHSCMATRKMQPRRHSSAALPSSIKLIDECVQRESPFLKFCWGYR